MDKLNYNEAVDRIKARFPMVPSGREKTTDVPTFPNQVYTDRVEEATQSRWNRRSEMLR